MSKLHKIWNLRSAVRRLKEIYRYERGEERRQILRDAINQTLKQIGNLEFSAYLEEGGVR